MRAVTLYFDKGWITPNFNSNFIVLVPKSSYANSMVQYKPIAFANFLFKIIPKILVDRLGPIAGKIISPNWSAFSKGWKITYCVCLAS